MASRRDPEAKRSAIEDAAVELFAEHGYAATSTQQIAKRAGVAEGTIFRHFGNKKALLGIVTGLFIRRIVAPVATRTLDEVLEREYATLDEFLGALFDDRARVVDKVPRMAKVVLQEISLHREVREPLKEIFEEVVIPKFVAAIIRLQQRELIDPDIPAGAVMRNIVSVFGGWFVLSDLIAPEADWDREAERAHSILILSRGLRPNPADLR